MKIGSSQVKDEITLTFISKIGITPRSTKNFLRWEAINSNALCTPAGSPTTSTTLSSLRAKIGRSSAEEKATQMVSNYTMSNSPPMDQNAKIGKKLQILSNTIFERINQNIKSNRYCFLHSSFIPLP